MIEQRLKTLEAKFKSIEVILFESKQDLSIEKIISLTKELERVSQSMYVLNQIKAARDQRNNQKTSDHVVEENKNDVELVAV